MGFFRNSSYPAEDYFHKFYQIFYFIFHCFFPFFPWNSIKTFTTPVKFPIAFFLSSPGVPSNVVLNRYGLFLEKHTRMMLMTVTMVANTKRTALGSIVDFMFSFMADEVLLHRGHRRKKCLNP